MARLRLPMSKCYGCGAPLDDRSEVGEHGSGASVSICLYCGAIGVFGEDLLLSRPVKAVLDEIFEDKEFRQLWIQAMWARAHLIAEGKGPHVRYVKGRPG